MFNIVSDRQVVKKALRTGWRTRSEELINIVFSYFPYHVVNLGIIKLVIPAKLSLLQSTKHQATRRDLNDINQCINQWFYRSELFLCRVGKLLLIQI